MPARYRSREAFPQTKPTLVRIEAREKLGFNMTRERARLAREAEDARKKRRHNRKANSKA